MTIVGALLEVRILHFVQKRGLDVLHFNQLITLLVSRLPNC